MVTKKGQKIEYEKSKNPSRERVLIQYNKKKGDGIVGRQEGREEGRNRRAQHNRATTPTTLAWQFPRIDLTRLACVALSLDGSRYCCSLVAVGRPSALSDLPPCGFSACCSISVYPFRAVVGAVLFSLRLGGRRLGSDRLGGCRRGSDRLRGRLGRRGF